MSAFHTDEYVQFLTRVTPETASSLTFSGKRCESQIELVGGTPDLIPHLLVLVGDDNPAFEGVFEFCSISAGGSIGASANCLED